MGSSTPSRAVSGARRRRRLRSRCVDCCLNGLRLQARAVLALALSYRFQWRWFTAIPAGLLIAGVALVMYGLVLRAARDAREAESGRDSHAPDL